MKNVVKNLALVGVGAAGGFMACGYLVITKALLSDTFREVVTMKIADKIEEWLFDETDTTIATDNEKIRVVNVNRNSSEPEFQDKGDKNT